jgi:nucleotide-binding universal stress UspA family protein
MLPCRRRRGPYRKILVPYDGSPGARAALKAAIDLANQTDAELHCICVREDVSYYGTTIGDVEDAKADQDAHLRALTEEARQCAAYFGVPLHTQILPGRALDVISATAVSNQFDLVVIGGASGSSVAGWLMGRTAQQLARRLPCKVLLVS